VSFQPSTRWMRLAKCRGKDPDTWQGDTPRDRVIAEVVCAKCPVRAACLNYALLKREPRGIWGGVDAKTRSTMLLFFRPEESHNSSTGGAVAS
jgi:WhiB family redox-sensing transcriptional regulator